MLIRASPPHLNVFKIPDEAMEDLVSDYISAIRFEEIYRQLKIETPAHRFRRLIFICVNKYVSELNNKPQLAFSEHRKRLSSLASTARKLRNTVASGDDVTVLLMKHAERTFGDIEKERKKDFSPVSA
jgi:hypothetical protein